MNSINFILFVIMMNVIWTQTHAKKQAGKSTTVSCITNENCEVFVGPGATCKNSVCVCENEELCKTHRIDARVKSNVIGEDCADDFNCNIQHSFCLDGFCACITERVTSNDGRRCLEVSGGLEEECEEDIQCTRKIPGSVCQNTKCVCDEYHEQDGSDCYSKVGLGQKCKLQSQCSHIDHAYCGPVFCECSSGFVQSASRTKCLPVATKPLDKCEETVQCRQLFPHGAKCMYGRCECDDIHRLANRTACPTRLKQVCANDEECKSYSDDPSMHCDMGRCECLFPYVEQDGVCNGSGSINSAVLSVRILAVMFILLLTFK